MTVWYSEKNRTVVKSSLAVDDIEIDELYFRISQKHTLTHALGQRFRYVNRNWTYYSSTFKFCQVIIVGGGRGFN